MNNYQSPESHNNELPKFDYKVNYVDPFYDKKQLKRLEIINLVVAQYGSSKESDEIIAIAEKYYNWINQ